MYIKQIKLKGFRTYKNETTIDFTKGINCIVGFNGSGKSNILLAIEFILSDMCEYKQVFLHEGIGNAVRSCYVEIIFDNSEKYFSMFKENEVKIKKVMENMKCEIYVNEKNISKNQYVELLESCGLCVNNLYNIIKQGQIIKLSNMKDEEILNYLKSILGAKIFEEKKKDALSMLKECDAKKGTIEKEFQEMNTKLESLQAEFEHFLEYKKLEKEKVHLEYHLNEINYKNVYKETQTLKSKLQELKNKTQDEDNNLSLTNNTKSDYTEQLNKMKLEIVSYQNELDKSVSEEIQNKRNIIHLEILIDEKRKEKKLKESKNKSKIENLNQINDFILRVTEKLQSLKSVMNLKEREIEDKNNEINMLLSANQTKNAKDGNYSHNVKKIEKMIGDINTELSVLEKEAIKNEKYLKELEEESKHLKNSVKENKTLSEKCADEISQLNSKSESCVEQKRQYQQKISEGTANLNVVKSQLIEVNDKYEEMIKSSNKEIVKMVELILEDSSIHKENVLGFLIDNINVDKTYVKAVDTVLENHYFTLIVEDMKTAKKIVEFIEKKREEKKKKEFEFKDFFFGKLTIVPLLNIRKYSDFIYPNDKNMVPLINCVNYNSKIYEFLKSILFKTVIVKSLECCQNYLEDNYNCVNIDGDYLSKQGFMYGGYNKKKYGVYTIYNKLKELKEKEKKEKSAIEEMSNSIDKIDEELRIIYDKKSNTVAQKNGCLTTLNSITNNIHANDENIRITSEKIKQIKEKKEHLEDYKEKLKVQILQLRNNNVNPDESPKGSVDINTLNEQVKKLKEELNKVTNEYDDFKNKLELLYQKRSENDSNIYMEEYEDVDIDEYTKELREKKNNIEKIEKEKMLYEQKIKQINKDMESVKSSLDKIYINEKKHKKKILDLCHQMNQINEELRILEGKEENIRKKKIILPQGIKDPNEYKNYDKQELSAKLKSITLELKKYSNVNEKAGDRLNILMSDFNELKKRNEEISTSYKNIKDMIQHIGKKKDEALEATYLKISKYFSEYFSLLFKNRKATLVLKKMSEQEYKDILRDGNEKRARKKMIDDEAYVDKITGISINITSKEDEKMSYTIQELSGGERSIVAICLFLCLNKIDNFSFFFFDEIDAALDTIHRDNLSLLLRELAQRGTQFIITTFRKELLEYCENMYIVRIVDRESYIARGSKKEAYEIISIEEKNAIEN
ncbi:structural maintenance of chromosomes protein 3, putative [Plasmodium knowlesi strain H]|uniref:Structural maintenance of chromosomes protein n=2 Tax=Plasmodium knowlesi TaxID=5850 RepID=A0A679KWN8_PLAKH|nr:structural maintenance of chromosomes protein 3, putative [Plasmodium knowlesi strain H]OTN68003.1 Structural maintenance of chromosomes protein [Plasmodium knowlesi]CAA9986943.1 structural maintenance of chromosomes protein 3, putative [Plasmodium knowlesi strain H]VVS76417.1 structural maintenance of chromosomes protein 3, putative [Plasmodium knowlesi strain H]